MEPDTQEPQHNISYEAVITDHTSETGSIAPGSGHHVEEPVPTFIEILAYFVNPPFTDPLGQPLFDPPSTRYIDSYSSYLFTTWFHHYTILWHEPTDFWFS
jgi:hypothetical protein